MNTEELPIGTTVTYDDGETVGYGEITERTFMGYVVRTSSGTSRMVQPSMITRVSGES